MAGNKTSVVICAYTEKRWTDTINAIDSVLLSDQPPLEVVLVVDHNPELFERFHSHYKNHNLVIVVENQDVRGLSGARNSGINASRGKYIGFLDDDAVADPGWLRELTDWCEKNACVMGAGSKVDPIWVDGEASWFPKEFNWVIGCTYEGMPNEVTEVRNPFGGCMVVKRNIFDLVGGFRTGTGRVGDIPLGCEETELCIRVRQAKPDSIFIYDPRTRIGHKVPGSRLTWRYFLSRCFNEGLSKALLARLVGSQDSLATEKSYSLKILPAGVARGLTDAVFRMDIDGAARATAIVMGFFSTVFGYLVGLVKVSQNQAQRHAVIGNIETANEL